MSLVALMLPCILAQVQEAWLTVTDNNPEVCELYNNDTCVKKKDLWAYGSCDITVKGDTLRHETLRVTVEFNGGSSNTFSRQDTSKYEDDIRQGGRGADKVQTRDVKGGARYRSPYSYSYYVGEGWKICVEKTAAIGKCHAMCSTCEWVAGADADSKDKIERCTSCQVGYRLTSPVGIDCRLDIFVTVVFCALATIAVVIALVGFMIFCAKCCCEPDETPSGQHAGDYEMALRLSREENARAARVRPQYGAPKVVDEPDGEPEYPETVIDVNDFLDTALADIQSIGTVLEPELEENLVEVDI